MARVAMTPKGTSLFALGTSSDRVVTASKPMKEKKTYGSVSVREGVGRRREGGGEGRDGWSGKGKEKKIERERERERACANETVEKRQCERNKGRERDFGVKRDKPCK